MKTYLTLALLVCVTACGKGGSGSGPGRSVPTVSPISCAVKFSNSDDLMTTALKANAARRDCGLSEEELVGQI